MSTSGPTSASTLSLPSSSPPAPDLLIRRLDQRLLEMESQLVEMKSQISKLEIRQSDLEQKISGITNTAPSSSTLRDATEEAQGATTSTPPRSLSLMGLEDVNRKISTLNQRLTQVETQLTLTVDNPIHIGQDEDRVDESLESIIIKEELEFADNEVMDQDVIVEWEEDPFGDGEEDQTQEVLEGDGQDTDAELILGGGEIEVDSSFINMDLKPQVAVAGSSFQSRYQSTSLDQVGIHLKSGATGRESRSQPQSGKVNIPNTRLRSPPTSVKAIPGPTPTPETILPTRSERKTRQTTRPAPGERLIYFQDARGLMASAAQQQDGRIRCLNCKSKSRFKFMCHIKHHFNSLHLHELGSNR